MTKSLYDVLQVSMNADVDVIEAAFQSRKSKYEGKYDLDSQNELNSIQWAYQVLINADSRSNYDNQLAQDRVPHVEAANLNEISYQSSGSADWWSGNKATVVIAIASLLAIIYMILDYKKENKKTELEAIPALGSVSNDSKSIDNISNISQQEQDRRKIELEIRAKAEAQNIEMRRQQQEQQLEMQRRQFEVQQQRQDAMLKIQQQQVEQQRVQREQQRIQREQRYYSCYNAAWDRFRGDGARAEMYCSSYK